MAATRKSSPTKKKTAPKTKATKNKAGAVLLDSKVAYSGPMFRVVTDTVKEPSGRVSVRDVVRHNGSVVILATIPGKKKKDPWIVMERQYRHAAGQYLWELPAGKLEPGELPLPGAKRELAEETGYQSKKWKKLLDYYPSPGIMGEKMYIFHAEELIPGEAHPEEDEFIDFRLVQLSEVLEMVDSGKIVDGKTLAGILFFTRQIIGKK